MSLVTGAFILLGLVALVWLAITAVNIHSQLHMEFLEPDPSKTGPQPSISAVVPARNEEEGVEDGLRSLLAQPGVDLEVIAINDHSTDRTGEILDRLATEDARVRVLHDPELPPGWLGKTNGLHRGSALATKDLLFFTDADIKHAPGCLAAAAAAMKKDKLDFITLAPRYHWVSIIEHA